MMELEFEPRPVGFQTLSIKSAVLQPTVLMTIELIENLLEQKIYFKKRFL